MLQGAQISQQEAVPADETEDRDSACSSGEPGGSASPGSHPQAEPTLGRASRARAGGKRQHEDAAELFCVCQQAHHADTAMVSCDSCSEWYHLRCMGLTQGAARSLKRWSCPLCLAARGSPTALEDALHRTRRTRWGLQACRVLESTCRHAENVPEARCCS